MRLRKPSSSVTQFASWISFIDTTLSSNATSTSGATCTETWFSLAARPCSLVSQTVCKRSSRPSHPQAWRSRSLRLRNASTLSGLVALSSPLLARSKTSGAQNKSMMSLALALYTAVRIYVWSVSSLVVLCLFHRVLLGEFSWLPIPGSIHCKGIFGLFAFVTSSVNISIELLRIPR